MVQKDIITEKKGCWQLIIQCPFSYYDAFSCKYRFFKSSNNTLTVVRPGSLKTETGFDNVLTFPICSEAPQFLPLLDSCCQIKILMTSKRRQGKEISSIEVCRQHTKVKIYLVYFHICYHTNYCLQICWSGHILLLPVVSQLRYIKSINHFKFLW